MARWSPRSLAIVDAAPLRPGLRAIAIGWRHRPLRRSDIGHVVASSNSSTGSPAIPPMSRRQTERPNEPVRARLLDLGGGHHPCMVTFVFVIIALLVLGMLGAFLDGLLWLTALSVVLMLAAIAYVSRRSTRAERA